MEKGIIAVNNICEYDEMVGAETLHPLVNVVDFSRLPPMRNIPVKRIFGYYAVYLKGRKYSELHYGRSNYNYAEGALVFMAPGQVAGVEDDGMPHQMTTRVLMFHPDLLRGTFLQPLMKRYSFFSYDTNEALFPTDEEKSTIIQCFGNIERELRNSDQCTLDVVVDYIKLVLDYCSRFYLRQFSFSQPQSRDILARLERMLDNYFLSDAPKTKGVPTVAFCAEELCLSTNYLSDLVRAATGLSALKTIHGKMLDVAKEKLTDLSKRVNEVATEIGFQQPQSFSSWFKKLEGCTPNEYRRSIMGQTSNQHNVL